MLTFNDLGQSSLQGESTSAGGWQHPLVLLIAASGALAVPGTSAMEHRHVRVVELTSSRPHEVSRALTEDEQRDTRSVLTHLRRVSGLSWDQLADVFGVSRRSVHFWASGKPLSADNERKLHRVHAVVVSCARPSVAETRTALMRPDEQGVSPLDLLADDRFAEATDLLGARTRRAPPARMSLSEEAREARRPPPPQELVGALQDRVHKDVGRGRPARTLRNKPSGRS